MKTFFARIIGKLLGDGTITKERGKSPRFHFTHHVPDYEWTIECYDKLKTYISFSKPAYRRSEDPRLRKGYSENYFVRSHVHPIITELYDIWYPNGQKIVPLEWMTPYFTDETLAWWYQDDGHLKIENGKISKIVLSTDSFTPEENKGLIDLLYRKYGFTFRLDGQNRIVLYERFQCITFLHIVEPYMNDVMHRKMNPHARIQPFAQKPAIRLPKQWTIEQPTKTINEALERLAYLLPNDTIDMTRVIKQFFPRPTHPIEKKHYQVRLTDTNRKRLHQLHEATGLSLSELATWCFHTKK